MQVPERIGIGWHWLAVPELRLLVVGIWVRTQVRSCGICGGQSGTGARFPLPILNPLTAPPSSQSIVRGWNNRSDSGRCTNRIQVSPHHKLQGHLYSSTSQAGSPTSE
jgi:hypothetical protein